MARFVISGIWNNKAVKAASKALKSLEKDTKKWSLAAKAAWTSAALAAAYYAKKGLQQSIQSSLANEKSQRQLSFALEAVAGANNSATIAAEANIAAMSRMYGITQTELRPALASLVRLTGNATEAFSGLDLALSLSGATGEDLQTTSEAIGKAYQGNFASLKKLNVALDANKVKNKDVDGVLSDLRKTYGKFAKQELTSTETALKKIKTAANDAAIVVGDSLVKAFMDLSQSTGGADGIAKAMEKAAYWGADLVASLQITVERLKADPIIGKLTQFLGKGVKLAKSLAFWATEEGRQRRITAAIQKANLAQVISLRNAEATALKKTKENADGVEETSKKTVEQLMAEEAARRAGFKITEDIDSIQTVAAAKRLEEARQYKMGLIDAAQAGYDALKSANDRLTMIFEAQKANFNVMKAVMELGINIPVTISRTTQNAIMGQSGYNPPDTATIGAILGQTSNYVNPDIGTRNAIMGQAPVNVTVNAGAVGSEQYLADLITRSITQANRSGISTTPAGALG